MEVIPKTKDNGVCISNEYTELNRFVICERYQLAFVEEALAKLKEACIFMKLDFNSGIWQLSLDKQLHKYTTFITPFGRFVYKGIPLGIIQVQ